LFWILIWYSCILSDEINKEYEDLFSEFLDQINISEYDEVGISVSPNVSIFEINASFILGRLLQLKYKKDVILGGLGIDYMLSFKDVYNELWQSIMKKFKYVFGAPSEISFDKLLEAKKNGNNKEVYKTLNGAIYYKDGILTCNEKQDALLTCPDYSDFDLSFYKICTP
jgi:hypothetical protein